MMKGAFVNLRCTKAPFIMKSTLASGLSRCNSPSGTGLPSSVNGRSQSPQTP